jgi:hypothetical protein
MENLGGGFYPAAAASNGIKSSPIRFLAFAAMIICSATR